MHKDDIVIQCEQHTGMPAMECRCK